MAGTSRRSHSCARARAARHAGHRLRGAPFTLASYAIEGGSSRDFSRMKAFMLSESAA